MGLRVSVVKHAHHSFDVDHAGKDTHRHRLAGAFEVLVASSKRLALIREYEREAAPNVHHLLAEVSEVADWVLVEGFKSSDLHKIEVWRAATQQQPIYPNDVFITAIASDGPLPEPTGRPVLDLNNAAAIASHLVANADRYHYRPELHA